MIYNCKIIRFSFFNILLIELNTISPIAGIKIIVLKLFNNIIELKFYRTIFVLLIYHFVKTLQFVKYNILFLLQVSREVLINSITIFIVNSLNLQRIYYKQIICLTVNFSKKERS